MSNLLDRLILSRGRPVTLHLTDNMRDELDIVGDAMGLSRSAVARIVIQFGLLCITTDDPAVEALMDRIAVGSTL